MPHPFMKKMFTHSVKEVQEEYGVREAGQLFEDSPVAHDALTEREYEYITTRDSFYMATVNSDGWPYVQHRGGPKGFLKVIDQKTIAFADFRGNDQYISVGNLRYSDKVSLILMDYPNRRRLKILGHCKVITEKEDLTQVAKLEPEDYGYPAHRAMVITVDSFDWNCPQHITQRFTIEEIEAMLPVQPDPAKASYALPTTQEVEKLGEGHIPVEVTGICGRAEKISEFILTPLEADTVAPDAGAHVSLAVRGHDSLVKTNAYSLINGPGDTTAFHIAVLMETDGECGSYFMHTTPRIGDRLYIQPPKNEFPLVENADHSLLIAGGIGITPILSMARTLRDSDSSFEMHYTARSKAHMAFKEEVTELTGNNGYFYSSREEPVAKINLNSVLANPKSNTHVYVCGPKGFIESVISTAAEKGWSKDQIHFELFGNPSAKQETDQPIEVKLQKSGKTIQVAKDQTVLDALLEAGITVGSSCKRGECATCKVPVLEGDIDHRDIVLDSYEKKAGNVMCSCVSRVKGTHLVLDL